MLINHGAQIIPGIFIALFFLYVIPVDAKTLMILVLGTALGGLIGPILRKKMPPQKIQLIKLVVLSILLLLVLSHHYCWFPLTKDTVALIHGNYYLLFLVCSFVAH